MSRVGKKIIEIPDSVTLEVNDNTVTTKGPKGELVLNVHPKIKIVKDDKTIRVETKANDKLSRSLHGLSRMLIANNIKGVNEGFEKKLEIKGVGYKAVVQGDKLILSVGYSHPVEIIAPNGIGFQVLKNTITVSGIDKQLVGQISANIRSVRKPEPYKGKGIKYSDELIRRKAGKAAKAVGA
jgi:large subunit ribosomal protein L6